MIKKILQVILIIVINKICFGQQIENDYKFNFLPVGLNFMPLKAAVDEPKMGLDYFTANSNMKVDIGNSFDVLGFDFKNSKTRITAGADFFAYAYVTSFLAYRLQIDAIDGFFGGNITYSKTFDANRLIGRFRYIHSSSHLVDGHWDASKLQWINNQYPSAYGNNYAEFLIANEASFFKTFYRYYGGFSFSTGKKTGDKSLDKVGYKIGGEYYIPDFFGKVFDKEESIILAANFDVKGIPVYIVNQNYIAGIKFGQWQSKGIIFYLSYYNGGDVFNQYFNQRVSRFGIGFMFDFI